MPLKEKTGSENGKIISFLQRKRLPELNEESLTHSDKVTTPGKKNCLARNICHSHRYRSIWISDIHLGTRGCNAEALLKFLRFVESDYLYLVGDIVDGWRLKRGWYWPQTHNDIVQKILRKARKGTKVIYVPGNHDEFLAPYVNSHFGGVDILENAIHETADGRRLLVLHGHEFDNIVRYSKWLAFVGDYAYQAAQYLNYLFNLTRRFFGKDYWSLSTYLKFKVKNAVNFISSFEEAVIHASRKHQVEGVVCGHIHHAHIRDIDGVTYYNDGDWVESCTALVEDFNGELHLVNWFEDESLPDSKSVGEKRVAEIAEI